MKISLCKRLLSSLRVEEEEPREELSEDWSVSSVGAVLGGCDSGWHRDIIHQKWFSVELLDILGFTTVEPWTNPVFFQLLQKQNCQRVFGEKGIVQGLHRVLLNILLTTWNASGWRHFWRPLVQTPFKMCLPSKRDCIARAPQKLSFENLEGWRWCNFSGSLWRHRKERGKAGMWAERTGSVLNKSLGLCPSFSAVPQWALGLPYIHEKMQDVCHQTNFENTNESPLFCSN